MKLSLLIKKHLIECNIRNFSDVTLQERRYALKRFCDAQGDVLAEEVTRNTIKAYLVEYKDKAKASTVNSNLRCIKAMFTYAVEENILDDNPVDGIKLLKEEKAVIRTYSSSAITEVLNNLNKLDFTSVRNKAVVILLVETGIRNSELCNIKTEDILDDCIRIHGKGNKVRYVPITLADNFIKKYPSRKLN